MARAAGWYHIFHIDDLRTLAPDWLRYCRQMRTNPQLYWRINGSIPKDIPTGDAYVKYGEAPWISEMYGYVFSAAEHKIDTKLLRGLVEYTDSGSSEPWPSGPAIIHYGLHCHVGKYHFTKYDYGDFDVNTCPRVFFRPPNAPRHRALCAETINTLNDAPATSTARCPPLPDGALPLRCLPHEQPGETRANIDEDCEGKAAEAATRRRSVKLFADVLQGARPPALLWALNGEYEEPGFMASARVACNPPGLRRGGAADARRIAVSPPPPAATTTTAAATASDTLSAYKAQEGDARRRTGGESDRPGGEGGGRHRAPTPEDLRPSTAAERAEAARGGGREAERVAAAAKSRVCVAAGASAARRCCRS